MNLACVGSIPNNLAVLFPLVTERLEQALTTPSRITSWTSDCHSALVKVICLNSECSYFCKSMHQGKNIAKNSVKKKIVSTVPCKRTVYRMVGNAESRAHCWSKHEVQNLRFSQMRHGLH